MITGQSPRVKWRENAEGQSRSIEEAKAIAKKFGVRIPGDAEFFLDELGWLQREITARGPRISKPAGGTVLWSDHLNINGKVPFLIRSDVLNSDEAIVAVFAHEMHELEALRPLLKEGKMSIEQYNAHTSPNNPGNFHDQAWDVADHLVSRMRREKENR